MAVIVIAVIFAAIVMLSYQDSMDKGRRGNTKLGLMRLEQAEEKCRVTKLAA